MPLSIAQKNSFTLAAVCLAALMFGLEISSVPVILPTLEQALHSGFQELQWIMNAYTIACTTVLMAAGTLADRYGRKRLLLASLAVFGLTSLVCGWAQDTGVLIAGRALQGLSGGAMLICQVAVLSHRFQDGAARGRAFGAWGIAFGVGLGFGPVIGSAIVAIASWQWVFLAHGPLALIALGLAWKGVDESRDPRQRKLDVAGIVSLSVAVFGLAWFITQGPSAGFASLATLASLGAAIVALIVFVIAERRCADPMFDFAVFRIRRFSGALLASAAMNFSFWPFMIYLPLYFQNGLGYGGLGTGLALLAYTLPTLVAPPLGEKLALRYRPDTVIPAGLFAICLGFALMKWGSGVAQASWLTMLPGCLLAGAGLGLINTPVTNTTTGAVPGDRAGMASGIDISVRMISLSINIALMGFLLVESVLASLRRHWPQAPADATLRAMAEALPAGNLGDGAAPAIPADVARIALTHGFGDVMLYGAAAVGLLALASLAAFRGARSRPRAVAGSGG